VEVGQPRHQFEVGVVEAVEEVGVAQEEVMMAPVAEDPLVLQAYFHHYLAWAQDPWVYYHSYP